jgi:hypothetical protein
MMLGCENPACTRVATVDALVLDPITLPGRVRE